MQRAPPEGHRRTDRARRHSYRTSVRNDATTVTARLLPGDCSEHRPKDTAEQTELDVKEAVAWAMRYLRKEESGTHLTMMVCAPRRDRSVLAVVDLADKVLEVVLRMTAAYELK